MIHPGDIISFSEMITQEGKMLQHGMHFRSNRPYSILLMSQRKNAPYPDKLSEDKRTLYYIGHDMYGHPKKTEVDQPLKTKKGTLTENGKFFCAAQSYRDNGKEEFVKVYEKIAQGIWTYNGLFKLINAYFKNDGKRNVCVFELQITEEINISHTTNSEFYSSPNRLIPTDIKIAVWKRDKGRCVICGANSNLHFDHIIPFSKGGTSTNVNNVRLLCQKHNLEKGDRIQ